MVSLDHKTKKLVATFIKILVVISLLLVVFWFAVANPYLIRRERQRFESATIELEKIAQEIQSKTGPAEKVETTKSCDRPNMKNSSGPLSCNVAIKLRYGNISPASASEEMKVISNLFPDQIRQGMGFSSEARSNNTMTFQENNPTTSFRSFFQDLPNTNLLACGIAYEHTGSKANQFTVDLVCSSKARAEHYPHDN